MTPEGNSQRHRRCLLPIGVSLDWVYLKNRNHKKEKTKQCGKCFPFKLSSLRTFDFYSWNVSKNSLVLNTISLQCSADQTF